MSTRELEAVEDYITAVHLQQRRPDLTAETTQTEIAALAAAGGIAPEEIVERVRTIYENEAEVVRREETARAAAEQARLEAEAAAQATLDAAATAAEKE